MVVVPSSRVALYGSLGGERVDLEGAEAEFGGLGKGQADLSQWFGDRGTVLDARRFEFGVRQCRGRDGQEKAE